MLEWECGFCGDYTPRESVKDRLKEEGQHHLKSEHQEELEEVFRESWGGNDCQAGCGYTFPRDPEEHPGFICPRCNRDHLNYFAGMRVFFHTEQVDS